MEAPVPARAPAFGTGALQRWPAGSAGCRVQGAVARSWLLVPPARLCSRLLLLLLWNKRWRAQCWDAGSLTLAPCCQQRAPLPCHWLEAPGRPGPQANGWHGLVDGTGPPALVNMPALDWKSGLPTLALNPRDGNEPQSLFATDVRRISRLTVDSSL